MLTFICQGTYNCLDKLLSVQFVFTSILFQSQSGLLDRDSWRLDLHEIQLQIETTEPWDSILSISWLSALAGGHITSKQDVFVLSLANIASLIVTVVGPQQDTSSLFLCLVSSSLELIDLTAHAYIAHLASLWSSTNQEAVCFETQRPSAPDREFPLTIQLFSTGQCTSLEAQSCYCPFLYS
jgi:hypothetical protein